MNPSRDVVLEVVLVILEQLVLGVLQLVSIHAPLLQGGLSG